MKAEIISTGTELLLGQILNTNSQYLSEKMSSLGIDLYFHSTVGDNKARLKGQLNISLDRSDLIIITGGLGPTLDDLTKETVADTLGVEMFLHQESLIEIEKFFKQIGKEMPRNNKKQALFPKGSLIVPNVWGTAPGAIIEHKGKIVIILPGPPKEMQPMFEATVEPWLKTKTSKEHGQFLVSKVLRLYGLGESAVEEAIQDLIEKQANPTIAPLYKGGEINLRITAKASNLDEINRLLAKTEVEIRSRLQDYIFGVDDQSLGKVVGQLLSTQNKTISLAESCTGGLISSNLTDVPGSSAYFMYGLVTYSNEAKTGILGVKEKTLNDFGAVSSQIAKEMAEGVKKIGPTDIGVAVTGIAGPDGGTPEKPVGLVYIALADENGCSVTKNQFAGDREAVKVLTANAALNMMRKRLLKV